MLCRYSKGENAVGRLVKPGIRGFVAKNYFLYLFLVLFLVMGIIFGTLGVKALTPEQLANLNQFINTSFSSISKAVDYQVTVKHAVWRNLTTIFKVWFLGLTVIGLPLILVIIFTRGFVLGFTVAFFLQNMGLKGLGVILLTIIPQNIIHIPALIGAGASALGFSIFLLKGRNENKAIASYFFRYSIMMLILSLVMVFAGIIEGYITPIVSKIVPF